MPSECRYISPRLALLSQKEDDAGREPQRQDHGRKMQFVQSRNAIETGTHDGSDEDHSYYCNTCALILAAEPE